MYDIKKIVRKFVRVDEENACGNVFFVNQFRSRANRLTVDCPKVRQKAEVTRQ